MEATALFGFNKFDGQVDDENDADSVLRIITKRLIMSELIASCVYMVLLFLVFKIASGIAYEDLMTVAFIPLSINIIFIIITYINLKRKSCWTLFVISSIIYLISTFIALTFIAAYRYDEDDLILSIVFSVCQLAYVLFLYKTFRKTVVVLSKTISSYTRKIKTICIILIGFSCLYAVLGIILTHSPLLKSKEEVFETEETTEVIDNEYMVY